MNQWLESVYSDGSKYFVSNPQPNFGETVRIKLRMYEDAPVKHVYLRSVPNGADTVTEAYRAYTAHGFSYYEAELKMTEMRMQYHFYLVCEDVIYFYNQKEITTYIPEQTYDFVLLANYRQPSWVKNSVFYQIFPERFCNGNPDNDVQTGEYDYRGNRPKKMSWEDRPLPYYEGFCMDFFGGDLQGIKEKIPYMKELGVTAVYLNPIFQAPSIHKYDCVDYFHVDPHFGGDEALAELSAALHENGMKLILDISINHTGVEHRWFNKDGVFFEKETGSYHNRNAKEREYYFYNNDAYNSYHVWAGFDTLPTLNYTSETLRQIIYKDQDSVLRKWLKQPYMIDGWRFDVADVFARKDEIQLAHEIWPQIRTSIREENPDAYILAEDWTDCTQYQQGSEWDSPMNYFGCARVLRSFLGIPDFFMMRYEPLRNVRYKMKAEDVKARVMQYLAKLPFVFWQNQFNLIDSHDVPRVHNYPYVHPEEYRGAVILQFMLIGTPSVYYGDEVGIDGGIEGDDGYRYPMPWSQIPGRQPERFAFYQKLMKLKQQTEALKEGGMKFLYAKDQIISLARFDEQEAYIAMMSTSDQDQWITLPVGAIGVDAEQFLHAEELFGYWPTMEVTKTKEIRMKVKAHEAYLLCCSLK